METIVTKFGGSSLASAAQFQKVKSIITANPQRRYVIPSAPGKRDPQDHKITDLLYLCHAHAQQGLAFNDLFQIIQKRYVEIISNLNLNFDLTPHLNKIQKDITAKANADYVASRGEYLNGLIVANLLDYQFIDAAELIFFDAKGSFDALKTQETIRNQLQKVKKAVIPGFYGSLPNGEIKTFSRGGSDVTGAIIAAGVGAKVYENWTDVSGFLMADPRIVKDPKPIEKITYRELRELAYMGATVLHEEAIFPVKSVGIPINIKNTNAPTDPGTLIIQDADPVTQMGCITGIAGRKDFTVIAVEKALMNSETGFGRKLLSILETNAVSFEHIPTGIDTMSIVVADSELENGKLDKILEEIEQQCRPESIQIHPHMALIATVGRGMAATPGIAARLFNALFQAKVNVRMIDQGSSEINIIVGVETADFEKAVQAIYAVFINN